MLSRNGQDRACVRMPTAQSLHPRAQQPISRSYLIDYLNLRTIVSGTQAAHIYCSYKEKETQTLVGLVGNISQQLLRYRKDKFSEALRLYNRHLAQCSRPLLNEQIQLLRALSAGTKTFIVVDALDELTEVDDVRLQFTTELCRLRPAISFIFTSRPLPSLDSVLAHASICEVRTCETDTRRYLEHCLPRSDTMRTHLQQEPDLMDAICSRIIEKSRGM